MIGFAAKKKVKRVCQNMSKTKIMKDLRHPGIENRNTFSVRRSEWWVKQDGM